VLSKKIPKRRNSVAHIRDEIKKIQEVGRVFVFERPARIGMKAFTEGISFPRKIYQSPFFEKVTWRALCIFINVASSSMRSFFARGLSYFLMSKNVTLFPIALPSAPMIIVGIKRSCPVLIK
jgi:hypothetical protein